MKKTFLFAALASVSLAACGASEAPAPAAETTEAVQSVVTVNDDASGPVFTGETGNLAVSGYDAVSYFTGEGVPVEGSEDHVVIYNDKEYRFASAENAKKFAADPAAFAPQYGGHCAWALARGYLAPGDATKYKIVDGKLYLNFNDEVQQTWLKDIPGFLMKSEEAWPGFTKDQRYDDAD